MKQVYICTKLSQNRIAEMVFKVNMENDAKKPMELRNSSMLLMAE